MIIIAIIKSKWLFCLEDGGQPFFHQVAFFSLLFVPQFFSSPKEDSESDLVDVPALSRRRKWHWRGICRQLFLGVIVGGKGELGKESPFRYNHWRGGEIMYKRARQNKERKGRENADTFLPLKFCHEIFGCSQDRTMKMVPLTHLAISPPLSLSAPHPSFSSWSQKEAPSSSSFFP